MSDGQRASDLPFPDAVFKAHQAIEQTSGTVFQKFTCGKCGARNTIDNPNVFHRTASCGDCGHVTDLEAAGCGFLLQIGRV